MSGGVIKRQGKGEHQIVTFTFAGPISQTQADAWNEAIVAIKESFEADAVKVLGITVKGDRTPSKYLPKPKKK